MDNNNNRGATPNRQIRRPVAGQPARRPASGGADTSPSGGGNRKRKKHSDSRWLRAILMVLVTIAGCVFLAMFILQSANDLFGLNQEDRQIEVEIPKDASLAQVASILAKAQIVNQQLTFQVYAGLKEDSKYEPGSYMFNANMGYDEILRDLRTGKSIKEEVTLYFVEGRTTYEIAKLLEENRVCNAQEFLDYLESAEFEYEFMDQMPDSALRFRRLEGYVFPDTYDFYVNEGVSSVAKKFITNFNNRMTDSMKAKMLDLNLTLDDTIILASVIQREAGDPVEMKQVSSVFHNRLDLPEQYPKLQSDVTKIYANSIKQFQEQTNQPMYDAYNTYVKDGLPIGPICNPGMDAINAALNPADTPYFFFVTDAEGKFYYAATAQEHYANMSIAAKVQGDGEGEIHGVDTE